jgi:hypothetical protein
VAPLAEFEHNGVGFSIVLLPGLDRLVLEHKPSPSLDWEELHGKDVPRGMTTAEAVDLMRRFVTGGISAEDYNRELPGR